MNIGIFETEHFEGAYPVIRLFDTGTNNITVFTYALPFRQFSFLFKENISRYHWVVQETKESKNGFIRRMYTEIKDRNIDLLYLNTISNNYHSYTILIKKVKAVRTIVTLHDINGYFQYSRAATFRQWVRQSGKRWLIKNVEEFNVVALTMVDHLKQKLPPHKKVHCLPGAIWEKENIAQARLPIDQVHIVVAGTVDVRRRNYSLVFEFLHLCNDLQLPVVVTLLGGHYGREGRSVLERCREYATKHDNLRYYDGNTVDQPEFDRVMNEAHVVWIPSVIKTVLHDGIMEEYGKTISSGNLFDVIKHAKPFVIPRALEVDPFLESSAFRYDTIPEIVDILQEVLADPEQYAGWCRLAWQNAENYTIDRVRARNPDLFA